MFDDLDQLVAAIVLAAQPGDHVVVMSNGGFGGIHDKLLDALQLARGAQGVVLSRMIVYLHGFRSSPRSTKARRLEARLHERGLGARYRCPQLPVSPRDAARVIEDVVASNGDEPLAVVGSSLGGYYATWIGERVDCRVVLINPATRPDRDLAAHLGAQPRLSRRRHGRGPPRTSRRARSRCARTAITRPDRYWLIAATGDELLDWREMVAALSGRATAHRRRRRPRRCRTSIATSTTSSTSRSARTSPADMQTSFASATILLLLVTDPLGNIPIFVAALRAVPPRRKAYVILRECLIAFAILLLFMFFGKGFMDVLGLSDVSLTIGGGVILFLIALRMVFPVPEGIFGTAPGGEPFIVPLAIPAIAGPSALATVLLLVSREPERLFEWIGALTVALATSAVVLVFADRLQRRLGERAVIAFERLMGLVLIAIAVEMVLKGIRAFVVQLPG